MKKGFLLIICILTFITCTTDMSLPLIITGEVSDVEKDGAVFHAKITGLGNKSIVEYGFVWDTIKNPRIERNEKYVFPEHALVKDLKTKISVNLAPLKTYYVRAFIRNSEITTYGENVTFKSQGSKAPEITSVSPLIGNLNDVIKIKGKYFSAINSIVRFNQIKASIISFNQDSILVRVPNELSTRTSVISVTTAVATTTVKDSFALFSPSITGFEPKMCTYYDEIILKGKNFLKNTSTLSVYFDSENATTSIIDDETLRVIVPSGLTKPSYTIKVIMNNIQSESGYKFTLTPVQITDYSPKTALTGSQITITGSNFSPVPANNKVTIGGVTAQLVSVTKDIMRVIMPTQDNAIYNNRNAVLQLEVAGNTATSTDKLLISDKWFRLHDAPVSLGSISDGSTAWNPYFNFKFAQSFQINNFAYIGLNLTNEFWAYDITNDSWKKLANFPGSPRKYGAGFVYQGKIYFGLGMKDTNLITPTYLSDWWEYDTKSNVWTKKSAFPESVDKIYRAFKTEDGCYVSNGISIGSTSQFTFTMNKYSPENDSWTKSSLDIGWVYYLSTNIWDWAVIQGSGNEILVGVNSGFFTSNVYAINTLLKSYKQIAPWTYGSNPEDWVAKFYLNNTYYIKSSNNSKVYHYDKTTNAWITDNQYVNINLNTGVNFSFENIGYAGLGSLNTMYQFDPNR